MSEETLQNAEDPRGSKHPSSVVRIPQEQAVRNYERKYAYWAWVPSQGHLYDGNFPGGEVVLSPMTTGEEKILAQSGKDRLEIIDTIIRRCLVDCPVPFDSLLIPDMFYLLLVIRNITYGACYQFRVECRKCRTNFRHALEIPADLKLRCLDETDEGEPWHVKLPMCGDEVSFRLLRVKDEYDIRRWSRQAYESTVQVGDPGYTYRLAKHIVQINGRDVDPVRKLQFVEDLIGRDSYTLRHAIENREFGATLILDTQCPNCGDEGKSSMPFDRDFFRPSDIGD